MIIRRARLQDADGLGVAMKAVVDEDRWLLTTPSATASALARRFRAGIEEGHVIFLLEDGPEIVGCVGMHPTSAAGVWSLGMFVLAAHRGAGLGRRLVDAALEAAPAAGIRKLELEVFTDNARALALYASAGFEVEGVRRDHYARDDGSTRSVVLMAHFPPAGP